MYFLSSGVKGLKMSQYTRIRVQLNPFTPESDQCQNSPAASQEIWHHTVWRTWLFIAYSDEKWLYYKFSYKSLIQSLFERLGEYRSEGVKKFKNSCHARPWLIMFVVFRFDSTRVSANQPSPIIYLSTYGSRLLIYLPNIPEPAPTISDY